ncbi:hypothetical protein SRABI70_02868 [Pseudomonas sp. Bi70]|nr:hypothetical protein SRABI70_02868 [Pseudomonas sp. Bi70]
MVSRAWRAPTRLTLLPSLAKWRIQNVIGSQATVDSPLAMNAIIF